MISLNKESLIPLRDAPKHVPVRPNGKRLHISAIYRWVNSGVSGVVLEAVRIGGTTYTSTEALQRFADRLSEGLRATPAPRPDARRLGRSNELTSARLEGELGLEPGSLSAPGQDLGRGRSTTSLPPSVGRRIESTRKDAKR